VSLALLRSALYVPGDRLERFETAIGSEADAVIIDLEDAVAPGQKPHARAAAAKLLRCLSPAKPVFVRVNGLASGLLEADIEALARSRIVGVRVPKVEGAHGVDAVRRLLDAAGLSVAVYCLIESARAVEFAYEIASSAGVAGIALGEADLRASLRVTADEALDYARARCVNAARAAGLPSPMLAVYGSTHDDEGLRRSTQRGKALGFFGRTAIHPRQLATINDVFTPTDEEVAAAREAVAGLDEALAGDSGARALPDGRFVDRAVVEHAREVLALAAHFGGARH
jgi:citrate lyase subunit beta / citryl-CoA lyase